MALLTMMVMSAVVIMTTRMRRDWFSSYTNTMLALQHTQHSISLFEVPSGVVEIYAAYQSCLVLSTVHRRFQ
jgi:hypothetical protein